MDHLKILVINPGLIRLNALGACEQDRLAGITQLRRLGHTVRLLTTGSAHQPLEAHRNYYIERGDEVDLLPYQRFPLHPLRLRRAGYLDGAAWEFGQPYFRAAVSRNLDQFKPDLVWCHASYVWPPALQARRRGLPTVIRSVNYESLHHQDQTLNLTWFDWVRIAGKSIGEHNAARSASVLAAITPDETALYERISRRGKLETLPLRTLPHLLRPPQPVRDRTPLHVFFMGASYSVPHNIVGLRFIVEEVVPLVRQAALGQFIFHVLGSKVPQSVLDLAAEDVVFEGYVPDLESFLSTMDIALSAWRMGRGMQQKVFEPLSRGFPMITHPRAMAGYAFEPEKHYLAAEDAPQTAAALLRLRDPSLRQSLAEGASQQSAAIFSQAELDARVERILKAALLG